MELSEDGGAVSREVGADSPDPPDDAPDVSPGPEELPVDLMRIKQQMSNQCFEMEVHLNAGKSKRTCCTSESERGVRDYITEMEGAKTVNFVSTLTLHRMQMWHAIGEKLKQNDSEAEALKAASGRCMTLNSHIKKLKQESRELQGEITEIQKKRLEMKRLTRDKLKEIEEVMSKKERPCSEKYKAALEKGQANLEKYKKMAAMTQNVLRGILLACKVNWLDDPRLRDIVMTLEELPISD